MITALESYVGELAGYTLVDMQQQLRFDFGVDASTSTITWQLFSLWYTLKQVHVEALHRFRQTLVTCARVYQVACGARHRKQHHKQTKMRQDFATKLLQHHRDGDLIVYYDETNYNLYCKRTQG